MRWWKRHNISQYLGFYKSVQNGSISPLDIRLIYYPWSNNSANMFIQDGPLTRFWRNMEWGRQSRTSTLETFSPVSRLYRSWADTHGIPSGLVWELGKSRPLISWTYRIKNSQNCSHQCLLDLLSLVNLQNQLCWFQILRD